MSQYTSQWSSDISESVNDPDVLINFCNVLKSQDDPKLLRIANDMLVDIGK